ncbi:MAG: isoprenylcysteine carboxylmethyltransferase family protein [Candidatus Thorarchaeota archaeon]|nr:isoprenylcysteine carboxylmethyltransferase family protein [Candidatus Thorarchaeota archaeon]
MIEYVIVVLTSSLFGMQHSGLSSLRVKERIIDKWGKEGYARIFNFTSILTLLIAFLSMNFWNWLYFITDPSQIQSLPFGLGILFAIAGIAVAAKASQVISVSTVSDMRTDRKPELITGGLYAQIRHPLYLATILIFGAMALIYPFPVVIVFALSMIAYTIIGAYFEERKLVLQYGDEYNEYKKQAGFILPRF